MNLFTVAIGDKYHKEALRLQKSLLPLIVKIISKEHPLYEKKHPDPLINGLWHKSNFANYIDDASRPVVFMDADMFTLTKNPFDGFKVEKGIELAYVPYSGKWHLPDRVRQDAFDFHGHKINSGFLWFDSLDTARKVCSKWQAEYLKRTELYGKTPNIDKNEYDEWALMIALSKLNVKVQLLDRKWNDWELSTKEEILESKSVFFQSHNFLNLDEISTT